jgi:hypothetical protein
VKKVIAYIIFVLALASPFFSFAGDADAQAITNSQTQGSISLNSDNSKSLNTYIDFSQLDIDEDEINDSENENCAFEKDANDSSTNASNYYFVTSSTKYKVEKFSRAESSPLHILHSVFRL